MNNKFAPLGTMINEPRWFLWKLTPDPKKPGHYSKVPHSLDGAHKIDHLQQANLTAFHTALQWRDYHNANLGQRFPAHEAYTLGYSLAEGCGRWFIDVDDGFNIVNGVFQGFANPQAEYLFNTLVQQHGCGYEVSTSGTGFHIFGLGHLPPHRKKNTALGLELYTEQRGIAFGLTDQLAGNFDNVSAHPVICETIQPYYFPMQPGVDEDGLALDFSNGPTDSSWRGPADDEDLLRRAINSSSTASAFGGRATFAELWENLPQLAHLFAGESEKDMALIAHLAFWTGKDPARMERLMLRSKLVRDKWNERRGELTWLQYSIVEQCRKPMNVLQDKPVETNEAPVAAGEAIEAVATRITSRTLLDADAQQELFAGCVYISELDGIFVPKRDGFGEVLNMSRFNTHFGGRSFFMDPENAITPSKKAWECFTQSQIVAFPRADRLTFDPLLAPGAIVNIQGQTHFNAYVPPVLERVQPEPGEIEGMLFDLVAKLLPDARDQQILLYYMAAVVQHQGRKFRWCPVIQGTQGNGKSTLANMLERAVGATMTHRVRSANLTNKFNGWLQGKTLIVVDDVKLDRRDKMALEILKPMVTEQYAEIERKGRDQVMSKVCANFLMSMNDKAGIPREDNERRYAIFYCAQQCRADRERDFDEDYFHELYDWLDNQQGYEKVSWWLANVTIPDEFNPATRCQRAPSTSAEREIKEVNEDEAVNLLREAIESEVCGMAGGYVSLKKAREFLQAAGIKAGHQRLRNTLETLGYHKHPQLNGGRSDNRVPAEGGLRLTIYCRDGHVSEGWESSAEIIKDYVARNYASGISDDLQSYAEAHCM